MPSSISARVTVSARWADSSRLSAKRFWLPRSNAVLSVKPLTMSISSRSRKYTPNGWTRLLSNCRPSVRSSSEPVANSTLPLMPMRPLFTVTRPAASGTANAFSSAMRRCSSIWRFCTSCCRLATRSICTTSTPTRISTKAPSSPAIRSPKTAHTGAVWSVASSRVSSTPITQAPLVLPWHGHAAGAGLPRCPVVR